MSVPANEIARRLTAFRAALVEASIDAALIVEATDLIYLTGVMADAHLLVPANDDPILLVRRSLERVQAESPLEDVRPFRSFKELPPLIAELGAKRVGLDLGMVWPTPLSTFLDQLDEFHFIVGLHPDSRQRIGKVPFHTTLVVWDMGSTEDPEETYRRLTPLVRTLMEKLRGEQAC